MVLLRLLTKNIKEIVLLTSIIVAAVVCQGFLKDATFDLQNHEKGKRLVHEMVEIMGGIDVYRRLKDVTYTYTYRDVAAGTQDVSTEIYVYQDEKSWGKYLEHTKSQLPDHEGILIQGYNGTESWVTLDGRLLEDSQAVRRADFTRKTNFYWLNMMFKLLDDGVHFKWIKETTKNSIVYDVVEITFGEDVGDAQDIYWLYINQETGMADQFLFTVMDFDRSEPLLMEVTYSRAFGLLWPTYRRYTSSNWEGEIDHKSKWIEEVSEELQFNQTVNHAIFEVPNVP